MGTSPGEEGESWTVVTLFEREGVGVTWTVVVLSGRTRG